MSTTWKIRKLFKGFRWIKKNDQNFHYFWLCPFKLTKFRITKHDPKACQVPKYMTWAFNLVDMDNEEKKTYKFGDTLYKSLHNIYKSRIHIASHSKIHLIINKHDNIDIKFFITICGVNINMLYDGCSRSWYFAMATWTV